MSHTVYTTPEQVEAAFYAAFEAADLETMRHVWFEDDSVICIHPLGARLQGYATVLDSWRQILDQVDGLHIRIGEQHYTRDTQISIHTVNEYLSLREHGHAHENRILSTNVYQLTPHGWRLVLHHASPAPRAQPHPRRPTSHLPEATPRRRGKILH